MGQRAPGITGAAFGGRGGGRRQAQTVWLLEPGNKLRPVEIRTGITDGHYTEVVSGDLKEGDNVIIGLATSKVEGPPPPGSSNPMVPRGGRGGR
jgi:HlyD family secretion protein